MLAICVDCGTASDESVGYCGCGGVRIVAESFPYEEANTSRWPQSALISSRIPGLNNVFFKYENGPLTGSFKDRIMRLAVANARLTQAKGVVVPSSGNAALAAAAAGAGAGLPVYAVVPKGTAPERITPVAARGAVIIEAGNDPSEAYRAADIIAAEFNLYRLYSTFAAPVAEWACRPIGIEASRQLGAGINTVVAPISAGPVLVGTGHGVAQQTGKLPALVAVQAQGCCPIVQAFDEHRTEVTPWTTSVDTSAVAIADRLNGYPQDGTYTLRLLRESGGLAAAVSDDEMMAARQALLQFDGIDVELSSAAGVAWLMRAQLRTSEPVLCILTASGFKHTYRGDISRAEITPERQDMAKHICEFVSQHAIRARLV